MSNHESLRDQVHALTESFVDGLFEALRDALGAAMARDIDDARGTLRGAWKGEFAKADALVNGADRRPKGVRRARVAGVTRDVAHEVAHEVAPTSTRRRVDAPDPASEIGAELDEGLVLDPELMLAALAKDGGGDGMTDARASRPRAPKPRPRAPTALLDDARSVSPDNRAAGDGAADDGAADDGAADAAATGPVLRDDEVAMQTAGGQVVIRRKRGTPFAA